MGWVAGGGGGGGGGAKFISPRPENSVLRAQRVPYYLLRLV